MIRAGKGRNELVEQHHDKKGLDLDNLPTLPEVEVEDEMKKFAEITEVDLYSNDENDMVLDEELVSDDDVEEDE